ncbi:MAG: Hsp20/alpha crystallin family protein [Erysipelotrichaceae bacterium]|nr:Hsp20/alpha crystallin family protein [Erysipelotrichaceae bacterium]MBR3151575.1 Hsp20/alpha crystallin family protein [Erysipelotrichaceae bacterium]MBR3167973.1 Hsp20/alpha crystallin family protein [Erysipelotrichaceae bacterium]MCR5300604.1 Hsp20/alpha crystallin family protein [Erysipelotrichaceae bacterium]
MKYVPTRFNFFDDAFDDMFFSPLRRYNVQNNLMMTDIREKDGLYILDIELPGYQKQDISIELKEGYLTVSAKQNTSNEEKDEKGNVLRKERYSGSCSRSFYVGEAIEPEDIKAGFENGILKVTLPSGKEKKTEPVRQITIE